MQVQGKGKPIYMFTAYLENPIARDTQPKEQPSQRWLPLALAAEPPVMKNSSDNSGVETDMQEADMVSKRQAQLADNVNVAAAVTKSSAAAGKAKTYSSTE